MMHAIFGDTQVTLVLGDITVQAVDAIVNAANSGLLGGGGVDGAIHRAGGPGFDAACRAAARLHAPLPPGQAVAVSGGRLPAKRVILTVGPVWHGGRADEARILANAYRSSLSLAREEGLRTIAFPSVSTGAYGYPLDEAAAVALTTVKAELEAHPGSFDEVRLVLFGERTLEAFEAALGALGAASQRASGGVDGLV
jgi:O-acetyl-ADP-ribose deacetylase